MVIRLPATGHVAAGVLVRSLATSAEAVPTLRAWSAGAGLIDQAAVREPAVREQAPEELSFDTFELAGSNMRILLSSREHVATKKA
jgi:hypothetical protein